MYDIFVMNASVIGAKIIQQTKQMFIKNGVLRVLTQQIITLIYVPQTANGQTNRYLRHKGYVGGIESGEGTCDHDLKKKHIVLGKILGEKALQLYVLEKNIQMLIVKQTPCKAILLIFFLSTDDRTLLYRLQNMIKFSPFRNLPQGRLRFQTLS